MTITVKVGEAKTRLSELISRVEAGEEVVIQRGHIAVVRLTALAPKPDVAAVIAQIKAMRAGRPPTTIEEVLAWRDEGRRF